MKILNYTPHAVTVFDGHDPVATFAPVGLARVQSESVTLSELDFGGPETIPLKKVVFGEIEGLPEEIGADDYFIVSAITAQAAVKNGYKYADRLLVVNEAVRNADGQIIGCRSFARV